MVRPVAAPSAIVRTPADAVKVEEMRPRGRKTQAQRPCGGVQASKNEVADHLTIVVIQCVYLRSEAALCLAKKRWTTQSPKCAVFGGLMPKAIRIAEFVIALLFLGTPYSGFAQAAGASLTGQVTDQAGAAIPNATV